MKVNGPRTKQNEKENFGTLMEIYLKEPGLMIKLMVMVVIFTQMVLNMKANGKMIYKRAMVLRIGQMDRDMKDIISVVKNMVTEHINGVMVRNLLVIGMTTKYLEKEFIPG